jgi:hypothetical protein
MSFFSFELLYLEMNMKEAFENLALQAPTESCREEPRTSCHTGSESKIHGGSNPVVWA